MTEFRKAERRRQVQRRMMKLVTVMSTVAAVLTAGYSFVSEGALEPKEIMVPPLVITVSEEETPVGSGPPPAAMKEPAQSTSEAAAIPAPPTYLGVFEITGYCSCDICCGKKDIKLTKMETVPKSGYTIAVDPQVIPLGSYLEIEGVTYRAEDIGQAIKDRSLDIFFSSHEEAVEFGRQKKDVYLK
ncbi:3D domain-containing protein [Hungatella sp.]|uniref:3D domain-containing protein n=1 Tax=Hungatella sp. TaxID=2613924 RepID=UPI002A7FCEEB|nr:3D domain-containing protein [Hungatella sp.]